MSGWQQWFEPAPAIKMQAGATVTALWAPNGGHLDLFVTGTDGAVWSNWWEPNKGWQQWFDIALAIKMQAGATVTALWAPNAPIGHLDLFVTGTDGAVWSNFWAAPLPDTWSVDSGELTTNDPLPLSGNCQLTMNQNGDWAFTSHAHDAGFDDIDYQISGVFLTTETPRPRSPLATRAISTELHTLLSVGAAMTTSGRKIRLRPKPLLFLTRGATTRTLRSIGPGYRAERGNAASVAKIRRGLGSRTCWGRPFSSWAKTRPGRFSRSSDSNWATCGCRVGALENSTLVVEPSSRQITLDTCDTRGPLSHFLDKRDSP